MGTLQRLESARDEVEFAAIARLVRDYGIQDVERATSINALLDARAKVAAWEDYARRTMRDLDLQLDAQNDLAELRLRQERKLGEILAEMNLNSKPKRGESRDVTLAQLGVPKMASSRWQRAASVPEEAFESYVAETREGRRELTSLGVQKLARQIEAQSVAVEVDEDPAATGCRIVADLSELTGETFGAIYADPAWRYGNQGTRAATDNHYGTMTVEEIATLPVASLGAVNSHLYMWTTNAFLEASFGVMRAWGFEFKSAAIWDKDQMGIGNYWRLQHEYLLLGVRGSLTFRDRAIPSVTRTGRTAHSAKPEAFRRQIERATPGPYLELFARRTAPGWVSFGNQVSHRPSLFEVSASPKTTAVSVPLEFDTETASQTR